MPDVHETLETWPAEAQRLREVAHTKGLEMYKVPKANLYVLKIQTGPQRGYPMFGFSVRDGYGADEAAVAAYLASFKRSAIATVEEDYKKPDGPLTEAQLAEGYDRGTRLHPAISGEALKAAAAR